jgi:hypothetical protein
MGVPEASDVIYACPNRALLIWERHPLMRWALRPDHEIAERKALCPAAWSAAGAGPGLAALFSTNKSKHQEMCMPGNLVP